MEFRTDRCLQGGIILRNGLDGRSASVDLKATLQLNGEGVLATTDEGGEHFLKWRSIAFSLGGHSQERIFMVGKSAGYTMYSDEPGALRVIETAGGNEVADRLERITPQDSASGRRGALSCLLLIGLVGFIGWSVPRIFHWSIERAVDIMPYSVDEQIGEVAHESMNAGSEVEDEELTAFIQGILDRLEPHTGVEDVQFQFRIVRDREPNAFALPGGYITVHSGLILEATNAEQVAGVLAHEMAHVLHRHGLRRMAHSLGLLAAVQLFVGDTDGLVAVAADLLSMATVNDYSQDQETDADLEAVRLMHAAALDPSALAGFFAALAEGHGEIPADLSWMSSHPQHAERILAIGREQALLTPMDYQSIEVDWPHLQELAR